MGVEPNLLEGLAQLAFVTQANTSVHYVTLLVDQDQRWDGFHFVIVPHVPIGIDQHWEGKVLILQELLSRFRVLVVDTDNHKPLTLETTVQLFNDRHLKPARTTPTGPELD